MKAKILVVGGGAMGTCLALHAAKRCDPLREPVVLIEKDRLGAGSSGRAAAIVHQGYSERVMAGMARDAVKGYSDMKATTGRSVGYRRTGVLLLAGAADVAARQQLERDIELQRDLAIDVRRVEADEIRGIIPGIVVHQEAVGAWQPEGGFVDPVRAIEVLAALARDYGAVTRVGATDLQVLVEGGRVAGLRTSLGEFRAPNVVLATGPWTPGILRELGVDLPLQAARTEEIFLRMPDPDVADDDELDDGGNELETRFVLDPLDRMPVAHPVLLDMGKDFHARCEPAARRTRFGQISFEGLPTAPTPEELPDSADREARQRLRRIVGERLPAYRDSEDMGGQSAWLTLTPDRRPVVGPVESIPGLYIVSGFSGNDFQLAPSIGEGLAQLILGQPVSAFDPAFFSPGRFATAGA